MWRGRRRVVWLLDNWFYNVLSEQSSSQTTWISVQCISQLETVLSLCLSCDYDNFRWLWQNSVIISGGSRISHGEGGADLVGWAPTPEAATFRKICMSKRKNLDPCSSGSRISRRGGTDLVGGANSRGGYVLKNLYVKMKESGPIGGRMLVVPPLDPPLPWVGGAHAGGAMIMMDFGSYDQFW